MSIKGWMIEKVAGSKLAALWIASRDFLKGKKVYIAGLVMILQGVAAFIDSMEGTTIRDALEVMRDPSIEIIKNGIDLLNAPGADRIVEGSLGMALRAGVAKIEKK